MKFRAIALGALLASGAHAQDQQTVSDISQAAPSNTPQKKDPLTLTLGIKLYSAGWTGDNSGDIDGDIKSDSGSGSGISIGLRKGKLFGVLNAQGANYKFKDKQPLYDPDPIDNDDADTLTISSGFFSLGVGYQVHPRVAVQGGIKSHGQTWDHFNREVLYTGVGFGVTGYIPMNKDWTLYGTLGLNSHSIEDQDGNDIGDGSSSSLELGAAYRISPASSISFGFKNESVTADFDSGNKQEHSMGSLYIGYNHGFKF